MASPLLVAAGGLGLFLLGMLVLRDALRTLAGSALQAGLARFTRTPAQAALSGALATAAVQSSSAIVITVVGFAGAGLIPFAGALGVVFGANVGTTLTGWLVALLGLRFGFAAAAPLLVLVGALTRLLVRGRGGSIGLALAGLGLAFVGLEALRTGFAETSSLAWLARFPGESAGQRLALVGIGVAATLVTQSSSAGVATVLAALHSGSLTLAQGAALVIGFDVGTTGSAALAAFGGSLAARRTSAAHVVFNLLSALLAFALLVPYAELAARGGWDAGEPELALVGFHTAFNLLGVLLALPFTAQFARWVERLVPERRARIAERLDARLLAEPEVALRAVAATLRDVQHAAFGPLSALLELGRVGEADMLAEIDAALHDTEQYLERVQHPASSGHADPREVAAFHVVDQLHRLSDRLRDPNAGAALARDATLRTEAVALEGILHGALHAEPEDARLATAAAALAAQRGAFRERTLAAASRGELGAREAMERLDAWRWLERVAYHAWRVTHHLARMQRFAKEPPEAPEPREPA